MINSNVLLSVQRALLGNITSNLRAVYVLIENETTFKLIFYYDHELTDEEEELASLTDTEFLSDFPSPNYNTSYEIYVLGYPKDIPKTGICVYKRFENYC
ncbi:MAG: hypothetical protein Q8K60_09755 [Parachlamydiaceae bacterium]|nr:hypothetical protein [Parachlamydiaceae bacterium]